MRKVLSFALAVFLAIPTTAWCIDAYGAEEAQKEFAVVLEAAPGISPTEAEAEAMRQPIGSDEEPEADENEKITAALVQQGYLRNDVPLSFELQDNLHTTCSEQGIPYHVALGLIESESGFNPNVDNGICYGLLALHRAYFPSNLTPLENMRTGIKCLGDHLKRYGTIEAALTAYNAGHDTGSRTYAGKVLERAEKWK